MLIEKREAMIRSKYPLDNNVLQEEYEALLIKLALKEYAAEQSEKLMRESNERLSTQPKQKTM